MVKVFNQNLFMPNSIVRLSHIDGVWCSFSRFYVVAAVYLVGTFNARCHCLSVV